MEKVNQFQLDLDMMDMGGDTSMNQISTMSSEKVTVQHHRKEIEGRRLPPKSRWLRQKRSQRRRLGRSRSLPVNCGRQSRRSRSSRRSSSPMHRLWEQGCRPGRAQDADEKVQGLKHKEQESSGSKKSRQQS